MILFLTYHKVLRGPETKPEFYSVPAGQLQRHLELLAQNGLRPLPVRDLINGDVERTTPDRASLEPTKAPPIANGLPTIPPLPFLAAPKSDEVGRRGEGRGEGSVPSPSSSSSSSSPSTSSPVPFLLSFDDGTLDHYEVVLPLLAKTGHTAIFFVPTAKLNRPGYLTSDMVREMAKAGHTIGLHGHEHRRLDDQGEEDIRVQMEVSRAILADLTGARPVFFAPPGGFMDRRVQAVALELDVRAIRTMRWGYNRRLDLAALECIPLNRNSTEAEFRRVLEFRSQALAYTAKQIARRLVPAGLYGPLRESVSRARGGK